MNKKNLMFFDTNFIYGKKPDINFFKVLKENGIEPYVSENVVIELKGQNVRKIKEDYDYLIKATQKNMCKLYFDLNFNIDLEKCYKESDKRMDKYILELFGNNIIPKQDNNETMDMLIERNRFKIAPFVNHNSDKGWVDTLIWLSFLKFCSHNHFEKYIFVTEDKGFLDNVDTLVEEFAIKCGNNKLEIKNFISCDEVLKKFNINLIEEGTEEKKPAFVKENLITGKINEQTIEQVRNTVKNVFYTTVSNDFEEWDEYNCKLKRKISLNEAEDFCNLIIKTISNYVFFSEINLNDYFNEIKVDCESSHLVDSKFIHEFAEQWSDILTNHLELKQAFLQFVLSNINSMYVVYNFDEDLPF